MPRYNRRRHIPPPPERSRSDVPPHLEPYVGPLTYSQFHELSSRLRRCIRPHSALAPLFTPDEINDRCDLTDEFAAILRELFAYTSEDRARLRQRAVDESQRSPHTVLLFDKSRRHTT